jgi:hypothetical protein
MLRGEKMGKGEGTICKPMRNPKAIMGALNPPELLYAGSVYLRYK